MIALDAKTGQPVKSFGKDGVVDLKVGVVFGNNQQIDLETGEIGIHSTPVIVKDVVLVGSSMKEGMTVTTHNNTKGLARGLRRADRKAAVDLQHDSAARRIRQRHVARQLVGDQRQRRHLDADHASTRSSGLVYLPVETPTSDFYGGKRPGNNLFGESLVCVDLATGKRKWHFQFVHHPLWNDDMSSAPLIADVTVDGRAAQGRRGAEQAGLAVGVRSRDRRADLADRGEGRCRRGTCPASGTRRRSRIRPRR